MTVAPSSRNAVARFKSDVMRIVCVACAALILSLLCLVVGYLIYLGIGFLNVRFFTQDPIPMGLDGAPGGMRNAIVGTIVLIAMASIAGVPTGILAGVYLSEYDAGSWLARPVRFISDVLAGVPSIVVGILAYELLVQSFASGYFANIPYFRDIQGYNAWAGAAALAFIMIPIVARTTEEMLRLVPGSYREASIALGASKAGTIIRVVVPSAIESITTGVMLAVARVAGETAPLLFTIIGTNQMPIEVDRHFPFIHSLGLQAQYPSLTLQVYNYAMRPDPLQKHQAWAGILVLIFLIFVLNLGVRYATRPRGKVKA
jgi:phosphate transport system permease protein